MSFLSKVLSENDDDFNVEKWISFARQTLKNDGKGSPKDFFEAFGEAMTKVHNAEGKFKSVLWEGSNPSGTEDRTWVRTYAYLKGISGYEDMLDGLDGNHSKAILEAFKKAGALPPKVPTRE